MIAGTIGLVVELMLEEDPLNTLTTLLNKLHLMDILLVKHQCFTQIVISVFV